MTSKQKRTLVLAGIIGTLFACYEEEEKTRLHRELHARVGKGIRAMVKRYGEDAVNAVVGDDANTLWGACVDHFTEQKITIEASTCVLAMVNLDEKVLAKWYGLSKSKLGNWAKPCTREDAVVLERASVDVAKEVWKRINASYEIETVKQMSVMERIELARKSARGRGNVFFKKK